MSDFSRTLALLRREKKISQRAAAGDLGVSQALLSHYENGLREPGLSFVVRAADYYGVSCDYLLGRSMARDGSAVPAERMEGTATETEHSQIVQAAALLLQVAESLESKQLSHEIESYFAVAIYKVYRYLYMADPAGVDAVFRAPQDRFEYLCDARMKEHELKIRLAANGEEGCGLTQENIWRMPLAPSEIARRYPDLSSALLTVLQQVSDSIDRKNKMQ